MIDKMDLQEEGEEHHRRRYIVLVLGIIALVAAIYFGPALRQREPDYYDPARTALVKATLLIEESHVHEQALIEQLRMAHEELGSAIAQLTKVADLDPDHRPSMDALRASLRSMEDPDYPRRTSPEKLQQSYREMLLQINALLREMDDRSKQGQ